MYSFFRNLLFLLPPERVHYLLMVPLEWICKLGFVKKIISKAFAPLSKPVTVMGLDFINPIGLAAGFDKNARFLNALQALGFSHVEIGTVTPKPQAGNPKPRLFRLPADKALINRMGFNNYGASVIAKNLKKYLNKNPNSKLIIGGNIGKNKDTPNEQAVSDYEICFKALQPLVHYFVVNVSSPNTPGLRLLQNKESLLQIWNQLQLLNESQKPILLKIAPDLDAENIQEIVDLVNQGAYHGLVISNTTLDRSNLKTNQDKLIQINNGGLSGKPLLQKSNYLLQTISQGLKRQVPIIGSGGVFTANDANAKLERGASLVQVWTGFIYQGPAIVKSIMKGLSL
jgi:dihydroorotate dehydrogenase